MIPPSRAPTCGTVILSFVAITYDKITFRIGTERCIAHKCVSTSLCGPVRMILRKLYRPTTEPTLVGKLINIYWRSS